MNQIIVNEDKPVYVVGDIHGNFNEFFYKIKNNNTLNNSIIVVAGDIGIGFEKTNYYIDLFKKHNTKLKERNILVYFIRGNHDNPSYFNNDNNEINIFSNIYTICDYTCIQTPTKRILCVGGGLSIDRLKRIDYNNYQIKQKSSKRVYWEDELPIYDEEKLNLIGDVDVIITHTCPSFFKPYDKKGVEYFMLFDSNLCGDLDNERGVMDSIYKYYKNKNIHIKKWFHGHMHFNDEYMYEDTQVHSMINIEKNGFLFNKV